jgi:membrane protein required for colicin V production
MFTSFDILILAIITASSILGAYGGIVKFIFSVLGFISSIVSTYFLYHYGYELCTRYLVSDVTSSIVSITFSYIISLVICTFFTHKLLIIFSLIRGGAIDKMLGFGAGVIRGIVISLVIFWAVAIFFTGSYLEAKTLEDVVKNTTIDKYPVWLQKSTATSHLDNISQNLLSMLPEEQLKLIKLPRITRGTVEVDELEKLHYKKKVLNKSKELPIDLKQELDEIMYEQPANEE